MEKIVWNSSFSVGVELLDGQHKQIIDAINLLLSAPEADVDSEAISEVLGRLNNFANEHFATEEQLLEQYGYPELEGQKEAHRVYRMKVVALCENTVNHRASVPEELRRFLEDWWVDHILKTDMRYRPFFAEHGVS